MKQYGFANDSRYGLTASIWTEDMKKGRRIASKLEYGTVMINDNLITHAFPQTPWGGIKESGIGRTHGKIGLMEMVEVKHIHLNRSKIHNIWWYKYSALKTEALKRSIGLIYGSGFFKKLKAFINILKIMPYFFKKSFS